MRPYAQSSLPQIQEITRRFPYSHGEPIAWVRGVPPKFFNAAGAHNAHVYAQGSGAPTDLGIPSLARPCFGDPVEIFWDSGEIPVFWGCGVTAQVVVMESLAGIEGVKVIGHAPGHMVCCDAPAEFDLIAKRGVSAAP